MGDRPVVARTVDGGHSLVVFVPSGRRNAIPPGSDLQGASLQDLEASAVEMTATEAVVEADGLHWMVQASGPVWAETAAADSAGLVFTALDGSGRRVEVSGLAPGPLPDDAALIAILNGVRANEADD